MRLSLSGHLPESKTFPGFDPARAPSPCFAADGVAVEDNLKTLNLVQQESGAKGWPH